MAQRPRPIPSGVRQARSLLYPAAPDEDRTPIEVPRPHPHEDEPTLPPPRPRSQQTEEDDQPTPVATRAAETSISSAETKKVRPPLASSSAETKKIRPIPTTSSATTQVRPIPTASATTQVRPIPTSATTPVRPIRAAPHGKAASTLPAVEDATELVVVRRSRHAPAQRTGAGSSPRGHALDEEDARTGTAATGTTNIIKPKNRKLVTSLWIVGLGAWVLVLVEIFARCSTPP